MSAGAGHNSGRSFERGQSWRKHVWTKARKQLMPTLPIEVVRLRVKRATELGLPYKTYAGIRASSGHDLIGFMFSNNALRVLRDGQAMPIDRQHKLKALIRSRKIGLVHAPVSVGALAQDILLDAAYPAPNLRQSWSEMRQHLRQIAADIGQPADRFVLVGDLGLERDWVEAGQLAGYLSTDTYF